MMKLSGAIVLAGALLIGSPLYAAGEGWNVNTGHSQPDDYTPGQGIPDGNGNGNGQGYGNGSGHGYGNGTGQGYGNGHGNGNDYGNGHGDGYGSGQGNGGGYGNGNGQGSGNDHSNVNSGFNADAVVDLPPEVWTQGQNNNQPPCQRCCTHENRSYTEGSVVKMEGVLLQCARDERSWGTNNLTWQRVK